MRKIRFRSSFNYAHGKTTGSDNTRSYENMILASNYRLHKQLGYHNSAHYSVEF